VVRKSAFTLIELVFAIVIIGIAVTALPLMNQALTKGSEDNLVQEAIFGASTVLSEATTYHWDENSIDANNTSGLANVINIGSLCDATSTSPRYRLRPGHILEPYHRKCIKDLSITQANQSTDNNVTDVNDLVGSSTLFIGASSASGYKDVTYTLNISVTTNVNFAGSANPDIKEINADIQDNAGNTIVSLSTYVANIGEIDYYKRSF